MTRSAEATPEKPVVHISFRDGSCSECGEPFLKDRFILFDGPDRPVCLPCGGLDHLIFLPSGDTALTRRATKYSVLSAVVVQFSRRRKRNERQGILVESAALEKAEAECLDDADARARARDRASVRREAMDLDYLKRFTAQLMDRYPGCPADEATAIAEHACEKYSGRVGRSASAKNLDDRAIDLAVRAHIRHVHTGYDRLLAAGTPRAEARESVLGQVDRVARKWMSGKAAS